MAFKGYITEEIAHDAIDGIISRREALRRLMLIGLSASAAAPLLAACSDDDDTAGDAGAQNDGDGDGDASSTTAATGSVATTTNSPEAFGPDGALKGVFAMSQGAKGSVLVIHENKGLTPHFVGFPRRLAGSGYNALAIDLLSRDGGTPLDQGAAQAALSAAPKERMVEDLKTGVSELLSRYPDQKVGVMGFCFGGGMTWSLLAAGEDRVSAAIPFYGPPPEQPDFSKTKAAVLAMYAGLDERVNASMGTAQAALKAAGLTYQVKTFPGVNHAFFNDTGERYDQAAATEAYQDVLGWFGQHLA